MRTLLEGPIFTVRSDDARSSIWLVRSDQPSDKPSLRDLDAVARLLGAVDAAKTTLILDLRAAVGRNDPEFEQRVLPVFNDITRPFVYRVILVRTEVGKMQVRRLSEPGVHVEIVTTEADANRCAEVRARRAG